MERADPLKSWPGYSGDHTKGKTSQVRVPRFIFWDSYFGATIP
jgi:hypothetical protein